MIAAEAVHGTLQQRFNDMVHIASVIANRATLGRVTPQQVVAVQREFNAYNKAMPPGTKALRGLAQRAIAMVEQNGPITPATYYATPTARNGLPKGLKNVAATTGHIYAVDPKNRSFKTQVGYVNPSEGQTPTDNVRRPSVDVAPNPNSYRVAHSRQFTPQDRQMPMGDVRASLARAPGPGMAALAPNGLIGEKYNSVGSYDRSQLDSRLSGALNSIGTDRRFDSLGVKSGYRTPERNRAVGGAKSSQHLSGKAVDVSGFRDLSRDTQSALVDKAMTQGVRGLGLYSSGALHMDVRNSPAAWGVGGSYSSSPASSFPAHLQQNVRDLMGLQPGQPYTPAHPSNIPTPTAKPTSPAVETSQRQALAAAMEKAGIRGLGATSQVAPVGQVERQSLPPDRQMPSGTPARQALAPDRSMPTARPNLSAALEKRGITSSAPSEALAPDRQMPTGPVRPNLSAALEKAKISTVNDSQPAKVDVSKTRVNPVTGEVQPGLNPLGPIQAYPSVSAVAPTNVAPIRTTLTPTGQIATRPKATPSVTSQPIGAIPSQPISPVTQQPRVVQPVQPRIVQPVQTPPVNVPALPNALSQQDFNSRYASPTPGLRASDVYGGAIGSAYSTGGNIVSRENSYGPTTVTNKYGVTTATMPDGKQAAYGKGPNLSGLTGAARPAIGGLAGGALGSLVGGPIGGIIGGLLGRQVATQGVSALGGNRQSQPGSGGGQASGGLGGLLGGMFGGGVVGNSRGDGSAGGGGAGGSSKSTASGGGGGKGNKRK